METDSVDKMATPKERRARVEVPKKLIKLGQVVLGQWVEYGLGFVPFCLDCKVPLRHVSAEGDVLFRCPVCMGEWVKDNKWIVEDHGKERSCKI